MRLIVFSCIAGGIDSAGWVMKHPSPEMPEPTVVNQIKQTTPHPYSMAAMLARSAEIVVNPGYLLYTDQEQEADAESLWMVEPLQWKHPDNSRRTSRYHKCLPHRFLPPHDVSLWIDGCLQIKSGLSLLDLAESVLTGCDIATFAHPARRNIYEEFAACRMFGKDSIRLMREQVDRYHEQGYPKQSGLFEAAVLFRRNTPAVAALGESWWAEIEAGSSRDQLSFPVVLSRHQMTAGIVPGSRAKNKFFTLRQHAPRHGAPPRVVAVSVFKPGTWNLLATQKWFLRQTTKSYRHVVFCPECPPDLSGIEWVKCGDGTQHNGVSSHVIGLRAAVDWLRAHHGSFDLCVVMDSDAFPVKPGWPVALLKLLRDEGREFASPVRTENTDAFPHVSFLAFTPKYAELVFSYLRIGAGLSLWKDTQQHTDVGAALPLDRCYPLLKSNTYSPNVTQHIIYGDLCFHAACGSRNPRMAGRQYWRQIAPRLIKEAVHLVPITPGWINKLVGEERFTPEQIATFPVLPPPAIFEALPADDLPADESSESVTATVAVAAEVTQ